jgi:hypothetical protein
MLIMHVVDHLLSLVTDLYHGHRVEVVDLRANAV